MPLWQGCWGMFPSTPTLRGSVGPEPMPFRDKPFGAIPLRGDSLRFATTSLWLITTLLQLLYALLHLLLRRRACKPRNPAVTRNENAIRGHGFPMESGQIGMGVRTRQVGQQRPLRSPSGVQGAQPPPVAQRVPLYQKRWRVGRWDSGVPHRKRSPYRRLAAAGTLMAS